MIPQSMEDPSSCARTGSLEIKSEHAALNRKHALRHSGLATTLIIGEGGVVRRRKSKGVVRKENARESRRKHISTAGNTSRTPRMHHGAAFVPDSWCAAHIICRRCSGTLWPFCETAVFRLPLVRVRAASMDLRSVRIDAKAFGVATAHDVAAAKVRVAQKPCQLRPN